MSADSPSRLESFDPGQTIPTTGTYRVIHLGHQPSGECLLFSGMAFPGCEACGDNLTFTLVREVRLRLDDEMRQRTFSRVQFMEPRAAQKG
jgi:hypothetical protein